MKAVFEEKGNRTIGNKQNLKGNKYKNIVCV